MKIQNSILTIILVLLSSFLLKAQRKDTIIFYDYCLLVNSPISRNLRMDVGIERIKCIKNNWYYASQISLTGGKWNGNFNNYNFYNPYFFSIMLQPFHLLYGKNLKIETGLSTSFQTFRYKNKRYPVTDSFPFFNDALHVFYTLGLRYTFKKQQISIKAILGLRYVINLQKNQSYFGDAGAGELGINWRFRKKTSKKGHINNN